MVLWWFVGTLVVDPVPLHFGIGGRVFSLYSGPAPSDTTVTLHLSMELVSKPRTATTIHWLQQRAAVEISDTVPSSPPQEWEMLYVIPDMHPTGFRIQQPRDGGGIPILEIGFPGRTLKIPLRPLDPGDGTFPGVWDRKEFPLFRDCQGAPDPALSILEVYEQGLCEKVRGEMEVIRKKMQGELRKRTRREIRVTLRVLNARRAWGVYVASWRNPQNPTIKERRLVVIRDGKWWQIPWDRGAHGYPISAFLRGDTLLLQAVDTSGNGGVRLTLKRYVLHQGDRIVFLKEPMNRPVILSMEGRVLPLLHIHIQQVAPMADTSGAYVALQQDGGGVRIMRVKARSSLLDRRTYWMITDFARIPHNAAEFRLIVGDHRGVWGVTPGRIMWYVTVRGQYRRGIVEWPDSLCIDVVGIRAGGGGVLWVCRDGSLWSVTFDSAAGILVQPRDTLDGCTIRKTFFTGGIVARCGEMFKTFRVYGFLEYPDIREVMVWKGPEVWVIPFVLPVVIPPRGIEIQCASAAIWRKGRGVHEVIQVFTDMEHRRVGIFFRKAGEKDTGSLCWWDLATGRVDLEGGVMQAVAGFQGEVWVVYRDGRLGWMGGR